MSIPNPLHPLLPPQMSYEKMRNPNIEEKPTPEERAKEETEAFARGKRYSVSNAHATGCECPKCQPDIWSHAPRTT